MEYYRQPPSDTLHALDSTLDGLTPAQAAARLARDGRNVLTEPPKPSLVKRFFQQLADPMILVLLAAALISAITSAYAHESFADVIIILIVVIINAVLGVYQERKAEQAIAALKAQGVRTIMLTGDSEAVASEISGQLGLDEYHAQLLPADKVNRVEELLATKGKNDILTFAGDGINDAPVLMRADVGIAMGAMGSDAAIEAADVVLMDDDPAKISLAMKISRKCMHIVYQNIVFALAVKAIFLLLGAFGIANMWWAVFADVGVMILAVLNAMRMLIVEKN